jgi:hypothetical protein
MYSKTSLYYGDDYSFLFSFFVYGRYSNYLKTVTKSVLCEFNVPEDRESLCVFVFNYAINGPWVFM